MNSCPPSSTLNSTASTCIDFSTQLTSKKCSDYFVNQENYLFVLDPGYLIKNGLSSKTFGMSEIMGYNITVTNFIGYGWWVSSTAMTT